jgi:drug/metabolite transporter (DMT)-like permease
MTPKFAKSQELLGFGYGLVGISIFSLTLPATRIALASFDPIFVGLGRAVLAAILSLGLLLVTKQPLPPRRCWLSIAIVIGGVIIGFPLLSAIALQKAPASYAAVIVSLLPLATALCGTWRGQERPSAAFWLFAVLGSGLAIGFALLAGGGGLRVTDLALLGAVAAAGLGYAEGAVLARQIGSWQVICWALLFSMPLLLPIVLQHLPTNWGAIPLQGWLSFLYVSVFSMFLGFFAWYRGLALGGIARVGQIQLLQPFLTILAAALLLGEPLSFNTVGFTLAVVMCVAGGRRAPIRKLQES